MKKAAWALLLLAGLSGCASIGPSTLSRDRFDYITAISDSGKSQMLLNLVKLRYGDAPVFLDMSSVINQYTVEGSLGYSSSSFAGQAAYTDRPTITYLPVSGEKFARGLVTPIPPTVILNLIQAAYPADLISATFGVATLG
jgi:hypothetical protein